MGNITIEREELTSEEAREVELEDFLRELVDIIAKRFDAQKADMEELRRTMDMIKEDDIIDLRRCMYEVKESISVLADRVEELAEKERKISRDILGAIID